MAEIVEHPGKYIRAHVLPKEMNVTAAAKLIEVSRPTLSNLLNGNADLSPEMAAKLEAAFHVPVRELLDLQSAWDAAKATATSPAAAIRAYVPPFLQLKAVDIEAWAVKGGISPRHRLSVLLRTLVNSTGVGLSRVNFPGNDDSERPGWDGEVVSELASPYIPSGCSGWEFGVNGNINKKADGDYEKSVVAVDATERKQMTFVFVTPRRWAGKDAWVKARRAEKKWKDVQALDAADLEQWLSQSIPGQVWFAGETGQAAQGAQSLDAAEQVWGADCEPKLSMDFFAEAVSEHRALIMHRLASGSNEPVVIHADSREEALGFLSAVFSRNDPDLGLYRDRIVVFREAGAFLKLGSRTSNFIPVIMSKEVEKEFAPYRNVMPAFIIYPKNATSTDPDIKLEPLGREGFDRALDAMGVDRDGIDQLGRESGRSLTVLRRRLSRLEAIRTPGWADDEETAALLVPYMLAGAWNSDNRADRAVLEILAGVNDYGLLERRLASLLSKESAPVWSVSSIRGVVSKIDVLFAIRNSVSKEDLERFFSTAEMVLAEIDPALDLPEEDQWAAAIHGKTRELSGTLREGLAETLVMLAVYGPNLFKERLGVDTAWMAEKMVSNLLTPLTRDVLESQSDKMPLYAEAAPERFLSIIEADLTGEAPVCLTLMRPINDVPFSPARRTGLIWALESLAWSEKLFMRTVVVLAKLSERVIDDRLMNKPSGSLSAIFRSWMPQTTAVLEKRKAAFTWVATHHPSVAWPICIEQFSETSRIGMHSKKPRWRPDGHGYGHPLSRTEDNDFCLFVFDVALNWPHHTRETISDLMRGLRGIEETLHDRVWDVVESWLAGSSEEEKVEIREVIRSNFLTHRVARRQKKAGKKLTSKERARAIYDRIVPSDPILRHAWLFRTPWVEESLGEIAEDDYDFKERDARIAEQRRIAVGEVVTVGGVSALIDLAQRGQGASQVGWALASIAPSDDVLAAQLEEIVVTGDLSGARSLIVSGALMKVSQASSTVLRKVIDNIPEVKQPYLLALAPFDSSTWSILEALSQATAEAYWTAVHPQWGSEDADALTGARQLMAIGRPMAAFHSVEHMLKRMPPYFLYELLVTIARSANTPPEPYKLDPYRIREAFKFITASGDVDAEKMAELEFQYIDLFDRGESQPVNLIRSMAREPGLYVQAVAFAFNRKDGGVDPVELQLDDPERRGARKLQCYKLLDRMDFEGAVDESFFERQNLIRWVNEVQNGLDVLGRRVIGDQMIGNMLAKTKAGEDGVWPKPSVRDALEQVANPDVQSGLFMGIVNSRGAIWRGEGGAQERSLAEKYRGWAKSIEFTHPRVGAFMHQLADRYNHEADGEDADAKIARRLGH
ncbi:helix-turn-helix domain-containing protein [Asticcacaulis sp.]|uniref:helix-turn-helix transcriptional regulator n=1 Tax=Asticcacaulis sp. TaxID=1872648 RepID=UPI00262348EA|nr:helix-turn-helix domain-containing protein [Asticcacaulis sp.]